MQQKIQEFLVAQNLQSSTLHPMNAGGGGRLYFTITTAEKKYILCYSTDILETKTFLSFTNTLSNLKIPVPSILALSESMEIVLQEHLGETSLLDMVLQEGHTPEVFTLYKKALSTLARLQVQAHTAIDYTLCLARKKFDATYAINDLLYFIDYFVKPNKIEYDEKEMQEEIATVATNIELMEPTFFMFRDCQGRNLMVHQKEVYFIDYQGGMEGPPAYDVASLLWQAKAALPLDWKQDLFDYYTRHLQMQLPAAELPNNFNEQYSLLLLIRLLQVLGAYGKRGLVEGKQHFIESIPFAIENLETFLLLYPLQNTYPSLYKVIIKIIANKHNYSKQIK
jgi:aminoglycoside/choline kinase family phosphotransferase